jgi:membrane-bound metal-dependent hydrolase YbcI (DUF457 family)
LLWLTHAGIPVLTAVAVGERMRARTGTGLARGHLAAAAVAGILPDLAQPHIWLADRQASFAHSLAFVAAAGLVVTLMWRAIPRLGATTALLCVLAVALHVGLDALSGGVPLFYPDTTVHGGSYIPVRYWPLADWAVAIALLGCWTYRRFAERPRS